MRADRGKMMKKWLKWWTGLLCAAVLMLGASVTVLAAEMGSITVEGAVEGVDYSIYRIFDLESFSSEGGGTGRYAYKLSEKWNGFSAGEYFTVDENGYIDWKAGNGQEAAKGFAEAAFAFAKREKIAADAVVQASAGEGKEASAVFANIPLGYYLVDSTAGALLSLDTARPDATVKEKNEAPGIEKTVQKEDGNYGADNSASVGDTVSFQVAITPRPGAEGYTLHDTMSEGLDFKGVNGIVLKKDGAVLKELAEGTDYRLYRGSSLQAEDGCTFEIVFEDDAFKQVTEKDAAYALEILYDAVLNEKAVTDGGGNTNKAHLSYGDKHRTDEKITTTYSFDLAVLKYAKGENGENKALKGAQFSLYPKKGCSPGTELSFRQQQKEEGYEGVIYKKLADGTDGLTVITTDATGRFRLEGLKAGTYYLKEIKAPDGYNLLKKPVEITIDETGSVLVGNEAADEVLVENKTGALLPSTGGVGTGIFYGTGVALMVGAGLVFLIGKKRRK